MFIKLEKDLENLGFEKEVHILEYKYIVDKGLVEGKADELFAKFKKKDELADDKYEIIKYLRDHKYITRFSKDSEYIRIYQKGIRIGEDRTMFVMKVVEDIKEAGLKDLRVAKSLRKQLVIVQYNKEENRPRFYRLDEITFD
ncbi:MAG: hypothetical protein ABII22_02930 [Candidatus Micrarchaeota archaeon]